MPTYKVEVGPHYTPGFDVYTVEAADEAEAQDLAELEALSYWKEFDWECATSEAQLVFNGDS